MLSMAPPELRISAGNKEMNDGRQFYPGGYARRETSTIRDAGSRDALRFRRRSAGRFSRTAR